MGALMLSSQESFTAGVQSCYTESELKAIALGYAEVMDENGHKGRYFIKDGKKWIHNLEALRKNLIDQYGRYIDDEELSANAPEGFGYDVEAYHLYNSPKLAKRYGQPTGIGVVANAWLERH
ncbi:hypothetical protein KRX11_01255 [Pasteurellaceae bacterium TAE3-ERU1]|nr:hypothetical protein [Pasteurellaceae bacterium TAE3-ERU1]